MTTPTPDRAAADQEAFEAYVRARGWPVQSVPLSAQDAYLAGAEHGREDRKWLAGRGWREVTEELRAELDRARAGLARVEAERDRLARIIHASFMLLPTVPGDSMAFVDNNLIPHVRAVADEFSILAGQVKSYERDAAPRPDEAEALRTALMQAVTKQLYECELRGRDAKEYRAACKATDKAAYDLREAENPSPAPSPVEAAADVERAFFEWFESHGAIRTANYYLGAHAAWLAANDAKGAV